MSTIVSTRPDRRRPLVLVVGLIAIVLWQSVFFRHGDPDTTLASPYRLGASGGRLTWQPEFVYFLYYLNLYPVTSISDSPREYSVEGARRLIAEQGHTLVMDRYWTVRYGELAKTYLYLPNVWWKGRPVRPHMLHANALGFTLALLALYAGFWRARQSVMGALLVLLIGSNPFQVDSVYANNNVFGWPITVTVLMLGLHLSFMRDRPPRLVAAIVVALASGAILGTVRQVRTEPTLVILAVAGRLSHGQRPASVAQSHPRCALGSGLRVLGRGVDAILRRQVHRGLPGGEGGRRPHVRGHAPTPPLLLALSLVRPRRLRSTSTGTCGPTSARFAMPGPSCNDATSGRRVPPGPARFLRRADARRVLGQGTAVRPHAAGDPGVHPAGQGEGAAGRRPRSAVVCVDHRPPPRSGS